VQKLLDTGSKDRQIIPLKKQENIMKKLSARFLFFCFAVIGMLFVTSLKAEETTSASGFSLGAVGGLVYNTTGLSSGGVSLSTKGKAAFGGGLTAEVSLPAKFGVEVDFLYIKRSFSQNTAEFFGTSVTSTASSGTLQIPVILRFRPIPFLNPGIGFYYGRSITNWSVSADNYNSTTTKYGKNDFGFVLAVGTGIPIGSIVNLVADLRYTRSLKDTGGSTSDSLKFSQLEFLAGLRFDL